MGRYDFDVLVIGGGIAGFVSAVTANSLGKRVGIVENRRLGGNCTSFTCIPSKALIGASHVRRQLSRLGRWGLTLDGPGAAKTEDVMAHVRSVVQRAYEKDQAETFERIGISVLFGGPEFVDNHQIVIDGRTLTSASFILAMGTRPLIPPIEGLQDIEYLTNETVFELNELPKSLMVLGGGVDGLEYASAFGGLGVEVTVIEMAPQLLPSAESELVQLLLRNLEEDGIQIRTGTKAVRFSEKKGRKVLAVESAGEGDAEIEAEAVLVTIGRKPSIEGLSLEKAGVKYGPRGVVADSKMRTSVSNIYACGDIVGPYQLASMAEYQGIIAGTNAVLPVKRGADYRDAVFVIFTEPTLAYVGLTEAQARDKHGHGLRVYEFDYANMRRAMVDGAERGKAKFICGRDGRLLGAHILGEAAAEVIHEVQVIKALRQPLHRLSNVTHAYPTYAQALVGRASQLAYLEKMERNPFVRNLLSVLPGYDNRLALARMRLAETGDVPSHDEGLLRTVDVSLRVSREPEKEVRAEAVRVSSRACLVQMPGEVTDPDETAVVMACSRIGTADVRDILLDFTSVERMNGLGATMLVKLAARAGGWGQRIMAFGVNERYRGVFRLTGLDRAVHLYDSEAQALIAAREPGESLSLAMGAERPRAAEPRDVSYWAEPVTRLQVPDVPSEAVSLNVSGRRPVGPVEGFGPLWQKTYRQRLSGRKVTPSEAIRALKEHLPEFQPSENRFYASPAGIEPGEIVLINASTPGGPVHTGVMVLYADEESFTFITPQGHPESGWVSFSAYEEAGSTVVQIVGLARANDPVYEAAFRLVGSRVQESIWRHVLSSLASHYGVRPEVQVHKERVGSRIRWTATSNVWYNAQVRSLIYTAAAPIRRIGGRARRGTDRRRHDESIRA